MLDGNSFQTKNLQKDAAIFETLIMEETGRKVTVNFQSRKREKNPNDKKGEQMKDKDHPLLLDVLELFDGQIIR